MYLEKIKSPEDVKKLNHVEIEELVKEMRMALLEKVSKHGGHFGPNLGMVEATVALHYVFNSPKDKFVFDVSHQTYCHKMLTGRADAFINSENYDDVTGYSNPDESAHDFFTIGHTSTSISLASGLAKARDLAGDNYNVVAIIGDGSLSGGEALEGLDFAYELDSNFIIVVNDNDMSIAENHGGLYENLKLLRNTDGKAECNLFKAMGLDYVFVKNGNNTQEVIEAFEQVKDSKKPVVVHMVTQKGKGYALAEKDKEAWHWSMPFDLETGKPTVSFGDGENYSDLTAEFLLKKMKEDKNVVAITSGTPGVFGFNEERREMAGKQFVDVGIAEEQAVALASGLAKGGAKPVYGASSTFLQRTYDQLSQDLCINNNPATILTFSASVYGMNDVTHIGFYDIPMISNIPNLVYLAPTCKEEYFAMLEWSMNQVAYPVVIRVPSNGVISTGKKADTDYSKLNKYEMTVKGSRVAVIALGDFYQLGEQVIEGLKTIDIDATLINPRYITGIDTDLLSSLKESHDVVITIEDGVLDGGFGEKITRYYGCDDMKVMNFGLKKEFPDCYKVGELLEENHLTAKQIVEDVKENLS